MTTKVQKWGNSLAIRIPKSFAEDTHLTRGSTVDLALRDGQIVIDPEAVLRFDLRKLLRGVTRQNVHRAVDTGERMGREVW